MMDESTTVKIFLPFSCLESPCGWLVGCANSKEGIVCITGIAHTERTALEIAERSRHTSNLHRGNDVITICGVWVNEIIVGSVKDLQNGSIVQSLFHHSQCWLTLRKQDFSLPLCHIDHFGTHTEMDMIVILYEPKDYLKSSELMDSVYKKGQPPRTNRTDLHYIAKALWTDSNWREEQNENLQNYTNLISSENGTLKKALTWFADKVYVVLQQIILFVAAVCKCQIVDNSVCRRVLDMTAVTQQMRYQFSQLQGAVASRKGSAKEKDWYCNLILVLLVDICLGVVIMVGVTNTGVIYSFAGHIISWADQVVTALQDLLHWMMGFPAGLKLNSQLDQFLGKFFLYHIYLWTGYLHYLRHLLATVLWYISRTGCIGLTIQLCLIQDLISMMTLHIYCFYVYAARLYFLQVYALSSLWRLFRGKKWNVLRMRVDTASYDVDQLFIGTLLFTVLLFTFPTTALYYFVFTALRLVVLLIQGCLHKMVALINSCPVYSLCLKAVGSHIIADNVQFSLIPRLPNRPLYLAMQLQGASFSDLLSRFEPTEGIVDAKYTWSVLGQRLLFGNLVYPWIEPHQKTTSTP